MNDTSAINGHVPPGMPGPETPTAASGLPLAPTEQVRQQRIEIPADQPLSIVLQAQQWGVVQGLLAKAPFEVVAEIIGSIGGQIQKQVQPQRESS